MKADGPEGASSNGFNENLALFQQGKCGMWIDATVAASFVSDPKASKVADKVGYALAPDNGLGKRGNWLWAWSLAIPAGTKKADAAEKFVSWATSKHYLELVASKDGWANVPPGTRTSRSPRASRRTGRSRPPARHCQSGEYAMPVGAQLSSRAGTVSRQSCGPDGAGVGRGCLETNTRNGPIRAGPVKAGLSATKLNRPWSSSRATTEDTRSRSASWLKLAASSPASGRPKSVTPSRCSTRRVMGRLAGEPV